MGTYDCVLNVTRASDGLKHAHSCSSVQHQAMPFERTDRCTICASPKPTLHQTLLVFIVFLRVPFVISVLLIECRVTPLNSRAFLGSRRHCYPYTFIACRCWARGQLSGHLSKSKQSVLGPLDVASRTAPSLHWARWRGAHAEMVRELVPSLGNSSNMRGDAARH